MIDPHIRIEGFDARSWANLLGVFASSPPPTDDAVPDRAQGSLFVVHDGNGNVLKALHTRKGRLRGVEYVGPSDLARIAEAERVRFAMALRDGAVDEITERLALRLSREDDYATQVLALARVVRELHDAQVLTVWPPSLTAFPMPTAGMVRRALDVVFPSEHAVVLALFEQERLWTAVVLRRRAGRVDLVAGPDVIARLCGPLGGDWRRDYRIVLAGVERGIAPVHLGLFADVDDARRLLRSDTPGSWAKAALVRDVVVHPMPAYVQVALAADGIRAVTDRSRRFTLGFDIPQIFAPLTQLARDRVAAVANVASVREMLGFDPLKTLATFLSGGRPSGGDGDGSDPDDEDEDADERDERDRADAAGSNDALDEK